MDFDIGLVNSTHGITLRCSWDIWIQMPVEFTDAEAIIAEHLGTSQ